MRTRIKTIASTITILGLLVAVGISIAAPQQSNALSGSDFHVGRIIDDSVFFSTGGMSPQQIQSFLASKVPNCDTNGNKIYSGSTTRRDYAIANGHNPPFTCLKDYRQTTISKSAESGLCNGYTPAGWQESAAEIIYNVSQTCGINPKVLIVLLQKEQSLVTDEWPWDTQYRSATGYGCPDTAACDSAYYGFFNQVYSAARQFKRYARDANLFNYQASRNNYIQYNPIASCGGSQVYIQNQATAGLYNFTPYQPNAAALNNLYGTGDNCSAYGNRNFWRLYNDWFNMSDSLLNGGLTMRTITAPDANPYRGETVTYSYTLTNNLSVSLPLDAVGVVGRYGNPYNGANRDFGWQGPVTLAPGETKQFNFTTTVTDTGTIYAWPAVNYLGDYVHYNNWGTQMNAHVPNLSLVSPLASSVSNPVAGQTATLSATIKNNEAVPIQLGGIGIPARFVNTYNYDTAWSSSVTLQPGETKTISGPITFDKAGSYTAWLSALIAGQYTTLSSTLNFNVQKATPNFQLTYIEGPNQTPAVGEDVVLKYKLKNNSGISMTLDAVGVVGRYGNPYNGPNRDFGWVGPVTFAAGEEKSFTTFTSNVSELQNFYAWVAINYQGTYTHYNNWGFMLTPHLPNLTYTSPLTINGGSAPALGQTNSVTATIKNNEPKPIRYSAIGIPARFYSNYNYDAVWQGAGTLAASGDTGDSVSLNGNIKFDKSGPYSVWGSININGQYITIENPRNLNL
jgi:hypothetical protein